MINVEEKYEVAKRFIDAQIDAVINLTDMDQKLVTAHALLAREIFEETWLSSHEEYRPAFEALLQELEDEVNKQIAEEKNNAGS